MAGGAADLLDFEQDGIGIAIDKQRLDALHVAALLAFAPQLAAAAAEIDGPPRAQRFLVTLAIHVGQHQHDAGVGVLGDGGYQTVSLGKVGRFGRFGGHLAGSFGNRLGNCERRARRPLRPAGKKLKILSIIGLAGAGQRLARRPCRSKQKRLQP